MLTPLCPGCAIYTCKYTAYATASITSITPRVLPAFYYYYYDDDDDDDDDDECVSVSGIRRSPPSGASDDDPGR